MAIRECNPSYAALRCQERRLYRELCETFRLLQRLDAAHCSNETYHETYLLYYAMSNDYMTLTAQLHAILPLAPVSTPAAVDTAADTEIDTAA